MENHKNSAKFIPRGNEKRIIKEIQGDIPIASRPFREISKQIGMSESEVIAAVRKMKQDKVIRKFGAVLRHQKSGYAENAILIISAGRQAPEKIGSKNWPAFAKSATATRGNRSSWGDMEFLPWSMPGGVN